MPPAGTGLRPDAVRKPRAARGRDSATRLAACAEGKRFRGNVYYVTDVMAGAIVIWDRRPVRGRCGRSIAWRRCRVMRVVNRSPFRAVVYRPRGYPRSFHSF
jgi:hypothetical protein